MDARDYLDQISKNERIIENKLFEKKRWLSIAINTTANIGGERVQSSGSKQKMADATITAADIGREIDALVQENRDIIKMIEKLDLKEYDILHKVYVQYMTLHEYAEIHGKSHSWSKDLHKKALKSLQRILDNGRKNDMGL